MAKARYTLIRGGQRLSWDTERLWRLSADLPVRSVPITSIPELQQNCWFQSRPPTIEEVAKHTARINAADVSYPVILNDRGGLMDGGHRLCKTYVEGRDEILAVQFEELPEPDEVIPGEFVMLSSDRITLREFVSHDLDALFDLYRRPETSEFESWSPHKDKSESLGLLQYWLDLSYEQPRQEFTLAIEFEGRMIGLCGLERGFGTETDDPRVGFLGFRVLPEFWGRGIATEAAQLMIEFGFDQLAMHRIHAGCAASNLTSERVLLKLGFSHEGTSESSFPIGDSWADYKTFGLLARNWQKT